MTSEKKMYMLEWSHGEGGNIMAFDKKEDAEEYLELFKVVNKEEYIYCQPTIEEVPLFTKADATHLKKKYRETIKEKERKHRKTHCPNCDKKRKSTWTFCPGCGTKLFIYN